MHQDLPRKEKRTKNKNRYSLIIKERLKVNTVLRHQSWHDIQYY